MAINTIRPSSEPVPRFAARASGWAAEAGRGPWVATAAELAADSARTEAPDRHRAAMATSPAAATAETARRCTVVISVHRAGRSPDRATSSPARR